MKTMTNKSIIIAAGGTGGHVFPAVCVADGLKRCGYDIIFVTDKRGKQYIGKYEANAIVQNINTSSRKKLYLSLIFNILRYFFKVMIIKPRMVIGFGGYPSIPFVLSAQILGIKTAIHEQNAVIGKANSLLSKKATIIATSFQNTIGLQASTKSLCVGNPTRFEDIYSKSETPNNSALTILIFGGSQGSKIFAGTVVDAICELGKTEKIKIYQQGRKDDLEKIKSKYTNAGIEFAVKDFFDNIGKLYQQADIIISRAGASSVFEIIGFQKPSILIPYKNSINGDQIENARYLEKHNACIVIQEEELSIDAIQKAICDIEQQSQQITNNLQSLRINNPVKKFIEYIQETI